MLSSERGEVEGQKGERGRGEGERECLSLGLCRLFETSKVTLVTHCPNKATPPIPKRFHQLKTKPVGAILSQANTTALALIRGFYTPAVQVWK